MGEAVLLLFASGSLVAFPKTSVGPAVFDDYPPALLVMNGSVGDSVGKGSSVGGVPQVVFLHVCKVHDKDTRPSSTVFTF